MPNNDDRPWNGPRQAVLRLDPSVSIRIVAGAPHADAVEQRITAIWQGEKARLGARLFDGSAFGLVSAHAGELVLTPMRYRDIVARRSAPDLRENGLIPPPLGVSGVLVLGADVVLGRRASHVAAHGGAWEAAPAGVLAVPDPRAQVLEELSEELGLEPAAVAAPELCGVICGGESAELVMRLRTSLSADEVLAVWRRKGSDEYEALMIVPLAKRADFLRTIGRQMVPGLATILDLAAASVET